MLVSGGWRGGGGFYLRFFLPSKIETFPWPVLKLVIFKAFETFTHTTYFLPKDLEEILLKNMLRHAHAYVQSCATRMRKEKSSTTRMKTPKDLEKFCSRTNSR